MWLEPEAGSRLLAPVAAEHVILFSCLTSAVICIALCPAVQIAGADPDQSFYALGGEGQRVAVTVATAASTATEARGSDPGLMTLPILPKPPADVSF